MKVKGITVELTRASANTNLQNQQSWLRNKLSSLASNDLFGVLRRGVFVRRRQRIAEFSKLALRA
jgi:hypothetical protein